MRRVLVMGVVSELMGRMDGRELVGNSTQEREEAVYGKTLQCEGVGKIYPRAGRSSLWEELTAIGW